MIIVKIIIFLIISIIIEIEAHSCTEKTCHGDLPGACNNCGCSCILGVIPDCGGGFCCNTVCANNCPFSPGCSCKQRPTEHAQVSCSGNQPNCNLLDGQCDCGINSCTSPKRICNLGNGNCQNCGSNAECILAHGFGHICLSGTCTGFSCVFDSECLSDSEARCFFGVCLPCTSNSNCAIGHGSKTACDAGTCVLPCSSGSCTSPKEICINSVCSSCSSNLQCVSEFGFGNICFGGICTIGCADDDDCSGSKPVCSGSVCVKCSPEGLTNNCPGISEQLCQADGTCVSTGEVETCCDFSVQPSCGSCGCLCFPFGIAFCTVGGCNLCASNCFSIFGGGNCQCRSPTGPITTVPCSFPQACDDTPSCTLGSCDATCESGECDLYDVPGCIDSFCPPSGLKICQKKCLADCGCPGELECDVPTGVCSAVCTEGLCENPTPVCNPVGPICEPCTLNSQCLNPLPTCIGGNCTGCFSSSQCSVPIPACDSGVCAACVGNGTIGTNCDLGEACFNGDCVESCVTAGCSNPTPICDASNGICQACIGNGIFLTNCQNGKACDSGLCIDNCTVTGCSNPTPICGANGVCTACVAAGQCFPDSCISGLCTGCIGDSDCTTLNKPKCDTGPGECIDCSVDAPGDALCSGKFPSDVRKCIGGSCFNVNCTLNSQCGGNEICCTDINQCRECCDSSDCISDTSAKCDGTGTCVPCTSNTHCLAGNGDEIECDTSLNPNTCIVPPVREICDFGRCRDCAGLLGNQQLANLECVTEYLEPQTCNAGNCEDGCTLNSQCDPGEVCCILEFTCGTCCLDAECPLTTAPVCTGNPVKSCKGCDNALFPDAFCTTKFGTPITNPKICDNGECKDGCAIGDCTGSKMICDRTCPGKKCDGLTQALADAQCTIEFASAHRCELSTGVCIELDCLITSDCLGLGLCCLLPFPPSCEECCIDLDCLTPEAGVCFGGTCGSCSNDAQCTFNTNFFAETLCVDGECIRPCTILGNNPCTDPANGFCDVLGLVGKAGTCIPCTQDGLLGGCVLVPDALICDNSICVKGLCLPGDNTPCSGSDVCCIDFQCHECCNGPDCSGSGQICGIPLIDIPENVFKCRDCVNGAECLLPNQHLGSKEFCNIRNSPNLGRCVSACDPEDGIFLNTCQDCTFGGDCASGSRNFCDLRGNKNCVTQCAPEDGIFAFQCVDCVATATHCLSGSRNFCDIKGNKDCVVKCDPEDALSLTAECVACIGTPTEGIIDLGCSANAILFGTGSPFDNQRCDGNGDCIDLCDNDEDGHILEDCNPCQIGIGPLRSCTWFASDGPKCDLFANGVCKQACPSNTVEDTLIQNCVQCRFLTGSDCVANAIAGQICDIDVGRPLLPSPEPANLCKDCILGGAQCLAQYGFSRDFCDTRTTNLCVDTCPPEDGVNLLGNCIPCITGIFDCVPFLFRKGGLCDVRGGNDCDDACDPEDGLRLLGLTCEKCNNFLGNPNTGCIDNTEREGDVCRGDDCERACTDATDGYKRDNEDNVNIDSGCGPCQAGIDVLPSFGDIFTCDWSRGGSGGNFSHFLSITHRFCDLQVNPGKCAEICPSGSFTDVLDLSCKQCIISPDCVSSNPGKICINGFCEDCTSDIQCLFGSPLQPFCKDGFCTGCSLCNTGDGCFLGLICGKCTIGTDCIWDPPNVLCDVSSTGNAPFSGTCVSSCPPGTIQTIIGTCEQCNFGYQCITDARGPPEYGIDSYCDITLTPNGCVDTCPGDLGKNKLLRQCFECTEGFDCAWAGSDSIDSGCVKPEGTIFTGGSGIFGDDDGINCAGVCDKFTGSFNKCVPNCPAAAGRYPTLLPNLFSDSAILDPESGTAVTSYTCKGCINGANCAWDGSASSNSLTCQKPLDGPCVEVCTSAQKLISSCDTFCNSTCSDILGGCSAGCTALCSGTETKNTICGDMCGVLSVCDSACNVVCGCPSGAGCAICKLGCEQICSDTLNFCVDQCKAAIDLVVCDGLCSVPNICPSSSPICGQICDPVCDPLNLAGLNCTIFCQSNSITNTDCAGVCDTSLFEPECVAQCNPTAGRQIAFIPDIFDPPETGILDIPHFTCIECKEGLDCAWRGSASSNQSICVKPSGTLFFTGDDGTNCAGICDRFTAGDNKCVANCPPTGGRFPGLFPNLIPEPGMATTWYTCKQCQTGSQCSYIGSASGNPSTCVKPFIGGCNDVCEGLQTMATLCVNECSNLCSPITSNCQDGCDEFCGFCSTNCLAVCDTGFISDLGLGGDCNAFCGDVCGFCGDACTTICNGLGSINCDGFCDDVCDLTGVIGVNCTKFCETPPSGFTAFINDCAGVCDNTGTINVCAINCDSEDGRLLGILPDPFDPPEVGILSMPHYTCAECQEGIDCAWFGSLSSNPSNCVKPNAGLFSLIGADDGSNCAGICSRRTNPNNKCVPNCAPPDGRLAGVFPVLFPEKGMASTWFTCEECLEGFQCAWLGSASSNPSTCFKPLGALCKDICEILEPVSSGCIQNCSGICTFIDQECESTCQSFCDTCNDGCLLGCTLGGSECTAICDAACGFCPAFCTSVCNALNPSECITFCEDLCDPLDVANVNCTTFCENPPSGFFDFGNDCAGICRRSTPQDPHICVPQCFDTDARIQAFLPDIFAPTEDEMLKVPWYTCRDCGLTIFDLGECLWHPTNKTCSAYISRDDGTLKGFGDCQGTPEGQPCPETGGLIGLDFSGYSCVPCTLIINCFWCDAIGPFCDAFGIFGQPGNCITCDVASIVNNTIPGPLLLSQPQTQFKNITIPPQNFVRTKKK